MRNMNITNTISDEAGLEGKQVMMMDASIMLSCPHTPCTPLQHQHHHDPQQLALFQSHTGVVRTDQRTRLDGTRDTLRQMRLLERGVYKRPLAQALPDPFHGLWRKQIVEWMYTLVGYCKLRHESAAAATYYLDVAVAHRLITTPCQYQLGAMTALYLALKVYDSPSMRIVKLSSLVKLGSGEFDEQDVVDMERQMVELLQWRLNPPTVNCFVQQYLSLLFPESGHESNVGTDGGDETHDTLSQRLEKIAFQCIELTMARDYFLSVEPSVLGYAVLLMAVEILEQQEHQHQHHHHHHSRRLLVDVNSFVNLMSLVALIDHASPALVRASILLDRTMKSLPIPSTMIKMEEEPSSSTTSATSVTTESGKYIDDASHASPTSTIDDHIPFIDPDCTNRFSPNFVVLQ